MILKRKGEKIMNASVAIQVLPKAENDDELMGIVKECQKIAVKAGAKEVSAYVKITYRPEGDVLTIEKKVTKHHQ